LAIYLKNHWRRSGWERNIKTSEEDIKQPHRQNVARAVGFGGAYE
jgi:hypothetical protein